MSDKRKQPTKTIAARKSEMASGGKANISFPVKEGEKADPGTEIVTQRLDRGLEVYDLGKRPIIHSSVLTLLIGILGDTYPVKTNLRFYRGQRRRDEQN